MEVGTAKAIIKIPAGTVVDVVSVAGDKITLKRGTATATLPLLSTDYPQREQAIKDAEAAKEAAAREAHEQKIKDEQLKEEQARESLKKKLEMAGPKPTVAVSPLNGSITIPRAMEREIKSRLKDPDSFQPRKVMDLQIVEKNGIICWHVQIAYGAKNSFNGYTLGVASAFMRGSTLLGLELKNP
jgi:hypothetical protein